jgi:hypothetical protein
MIRARRVFSAWIARAGVSIRSLSIIVATGAVIAVPGADAQMRTYKGDLTSRTLIFDVTTTDGGQQQVETWFAQWVGNVYAKSIETNQPGFGIIKRKKPVCETASWIAPKRHIWREGDEPYLTRTHDLKYLRLDHSIKSAKCERVRDETRRVSKGALKRAQGWFSARNATNTPTSRDHRKLGSVEDWIEHNVPGFISVDLRN